MKWTTLSVKCYKIETFSIKNTQNIFVDWKSGYCILKQVQKWLKMPKIELWSYTHFSVSSRELYMCLKFYFLVGLLNSN